MVSRQRSCTRLALIAWGLALAACALFMQGTRVDAAEPDRLANRDSPPARFGNDANVPQRLAFPCRDGLLFDPRFGVPIGVACSTIDTPHRSVRAGTQAIESPRDVLPASPPTAPGVAATLGAPAVEVSLLAAPIAQVAPSDTPRLVALPETGRARRIAVSRPTGDALRLVIGTLLVVAGIGLRRAGGRRAIPRRIVPCRESGRVRARLRGVASAVRDRGLCRLQTGDRDPLRGSVLLRRAPAATLDQPVARILAALRSVGPCGRAVALAPTGMMALACPTGRADTAVSRERPRVAIRGCDLDTGNDWAGGYGRPLSRKTARHRGRRAAIGTSLLTAAYRSAAMPRGDYWDTRETEEEDQGMMDTHIAIVEEEPIMRRARILLPPAEENPRPPASPNQVGWAHRVSVVIPTLNEAANLPHVLPRIPGWVHEVVVVDGRSADDTVAVARALLPAVRVVMEPRPGKGAALRAGFAAATGDIVVMLDADGSMDPGEIPAYVAALLAGADFAKGSRFLPGGGTADMMALRRAGNAALTGLVRLLFGGGYTDLCYGYSAFWRRVVPLLALDADGFEIETQMNVRALRAGLAVAEVPSFEAARVHGASNLRTFPDGWRVLKAIARERRAPAARWAAIPADQPAIRAPIPLRGDGERDTPPVTHAGE